MASTKVSALTILFNAANNYATYYCRESAKNNVKKHSSSKKQKSVDLKPVKDSISLLSKKYDQEVIDDNIYSLLTMVVPGALICGGTVIGLLVLPTRVGAFVFAISNSSTSQIAYTTSKYLVVMSGIGIASEYYKSDIGKRKKNK